MSLCLKCFHLLLLEPNFHDVLPELVVPNRSGPAPSRPRAEPGRAAALEFPGSRRPRRSNRAGGTGKAESRPSPSSTGDLVTGKREVRPERRQPASQRAQVPSPARGSSGPAVQREGRAVLPAAAAGGGRVHRDSGGGRGEGRARSRVGRLRGQPGLAEAERKLLSRRRPCGRPPGALRRWPTRGVGAPTPGAGRRTRRRRARAP